jgi:DNA-binding CsgD family transcriptional regulator
MTRSALSARDLSQASELIGAIYDCAIDPTLWEPTLDAVKTTFRCANATLFVLDAVTGTPRVSLTVGVEPEWEQRMMAYSPHIADLCHRVDSEAVSVPGHIFVLRQDVTDDVLLSNRYFVEWAQPQGIDDLIQVTLLSERGRLSLLAMGRYGCDGRIGEHEIELMTLLAPHLRRAIAISDLIDLRSLRADALTATFDLMTTGVVLVNAERAVLYLNSAAREILEACGLTVNAAGRLGAIDTAQQLRIRDALGEAGERRSDGSGIPLTCASGRLHLAYVLPIRVGSARPHLMPDAAAAIFLTSATSPPGDLGVVAEVFGLTPAETRLLERLLGGASLDEAAAALNVARTTTRTHLDRILGKTGTRRQAALVSLIHRLVPGVRSGPP